MGQVADGRIQKTKYRSENLQQAKAIAQTELYDVKLADADKTTTSAVVEVNDG